MNLTINTTFIQANETYFKMLEDQLSKIVETAEFIEYVHNSRQIYIRHDKRIQKGDYCCIAMEPQINLTRTVKYGHIAQKLQMTVIRHPMIYTLGSGENNISTHVMTGPLSKEDFIDGLNVCEQWKVILNEFVKGCELPEQTQAEQSV